MNRTTYKLVRTIYVLARVLCVGMGVCGFGLILGAAGASDLNDAAPMGGIIVQVLLGLGMILAAWGLNEVLAGE